MKLASLEHSSDARADLTSASTPKAARSARTSRFAFAAVGMGLSAMTVFATGCAHEPSPLPPASVWPESPAAQQAAPSSTQAMAEKHRGQVSVSDEIRRICNVRDAEAKETQFGFDSMDLNDSEKKVLAQVAKCFTQGPLKGRAMKLTGRADPRGETEYNLTLGSHRAGTVKGYLHTMGVDAAKMADTSRGELDATGEDEGGWAHDRRVDIDLRK